MAWDWFESEMDLESVCFLMSTVKNFLEVPKAVFIVKETKLIKHLIDLSKKEKQVWAEILRLLSNYYMLVPSEIKQLVEELMLPVMSKTLLQTSELTDLNPQLQLWILLLMNTENVWYDRVVFKFKEKKYEKFLKLIAIHKRVAQMIDKEDMIEPESKLET